jgi:cytidyltransferase-like protein
MANEKIIPFAQTATLCADLRAAGKTIVHCHGTFDMIHPGHIVHFEEARALGDVLVVTITGEEHVNKGPGRPYFNDQLRSRWIAALSPVDYVVVVPHPAAVEAIECVAAHFYCKGREYATAANDVTGNIADDLAAVERMGGEVRYVGSIVFSSTRLLNSHFEPYPPNVKAFCRAVAAECSPDRFRQIVDSFSTMRVLIIGDLIFDRYTTVEVQGLTSKNRILSGRHMDDDMQAGGALAVYRHMREFTPHVKLISLAGTEPWLDSTLAEFIEPDGDAIIRSPEFTTIVKQRFVEPRAEGKELSKLFSVNYIDKEKPSPALQQAVNRRIDDYIDDYDLVLVMDTTSSTAATAGPTSLPSTRPSCSSPSAPAIWITARSSPSSPANSAAATRGLPAARTKRLVATASKTSHRARPLSARWWTRSVRATPFARSPVWPPPARCRSTSPPLWASSLAPSRCASSAIPNRSGRLVC